MTTAYQIIVDAYRQSNLTSLGVAPTLAQEVEALRYLNRLVKSVFGNEVGDQLQAFPIGRNDIVAPSGYPWWNNNPGRDWFVPKNTRVVLNTTQTVTLNLNPNPDDGSRFAVNNPSDNLSTYPVTIVGNGRQIEGADTLLLNVDGYSAEWFYRADLGNWQKYSPLTNFDTFPFPEEFDDYFILLLAFRLNPAYERQLDPQSAEMLRRVGSQFKARYQQHIPVQSELGLISPSKMTQDRRYWWDRSGYYDPNVRFDTGWPY